MPEKLSGPDLQSQSSQSKKRKQQSPSPSPSTSTSQQSTIPQLFAISSSSSPSSSSSNTCPPTPHSHPRRHLQDPPNPKRSRSNSTNFSASRSNHPAKLLTPLTKATMLNFGSSAKVIDLTGSPPAGAANKSVKGKERESVKPPPFQPRTGARKLQVKNFREPTKGDPEAYFRATWASLDAALTAIFNGERISTSLEELYRGTENICRAERATPLFEKLKVRMNKYVEGPLKAGIVERAGRSEEETVKAIEAAWTKWNQQLGMIRSIFLYLDRSYLLPSSTLKSIEVTGLALFRSHIASNTDLESKFLRGIFTLFDQDRKNQGQIVYITLLLSCIRMISSLGLYLRKFEPKFINVSREYFARLAAHESTSVPLSQYLHECTTQLTSESSRCDRFHLELSSKRLLIAVIEDEMIRKCLPILTDRASVGALLVSRDFNPLSTLYSLLGRVTPAGEAIRPAWETHIATFGASIVTDDTRTEDMVPRLLEFKHALDTMYTVPFKRDDTLGYTLRESFAAFINARRPGQTSTNNSKPAEMIAKFVDLLLRTGTKGLPASTTKEMIDLVAAAGDDDAQLAFQLEQVLDLFRFIHGKDVFEAFYKRDLARRLLMGRSASADAERMMLTKLKTECGSGFTHNLEGMFKDVDLSREAVASFKTSKASNLPGNIDLFVNVLSASAWPTYPEIAVNIPASLSAYLGAFQDFYVAKHSGRKLAWRHGLSHCVLKASFTKGNKELALSAFQAIVLLLFNDPTTTILSFADLLTGSGLPADQLTRTLQSMACGKHRVLAKAPRGKDVAPTDRFNVNTGFTDPKFRVKINQIQLKETKEEVKETHERVAQDRQYETQAAIIRIMKGKKSVRHTELVGLTIEQTKNRGVLDVGDIKKNIERLIDKEYMERGEDNTYVYVA